MFIANTDQGKCLSARGEIIPVDRKNDRLGSELQRSVSNTIVRVYCHKTSRAVSGKCHVENAPTSLLGVGHASRPASYKTFFDWSRTRANVGKNVLEVRAKYRDRFFPEISSENGIPK